MSLVPILILHASAGVVALVAGTLAMVFRKGSSRHDTSGIVFSVSMLVLAASGVYIASIKAQPGNIIGGALALYIVTTAWMAARRRTRGIGVGDWLIAAVALSVGAGSIAFGVLVARGLMASHGVPAAMAYFLGGVTLAAGAGDIHVLARRGPTGIQRIARHLWRMCFALFIASGSFFMGRQQMFPAFIRQSGILILLTVLPLVLLMYWAVRVRVTRRNIAVNS